jgi:hypothetical protein
VKNKDFVEYQEALELKQLGFNEPCLAFYNGKFLDSTQYDFDNCSMKDIGQCLLAPTYSQAFRWFREKHNLEGIFQHAQERLWYKFHISTYLEYGKKNIYAGFEYPTYEEAEFACLKKLIEIVK